MHVRFPQCGEGLDSTKADFAAEVAATVEKNQPDVGAADKGSVAVTAMFAMELAAFSPSFGDSSFGD